MQLVNMTVIHLMIGNKVKDDLIMVLGSTMVGYFNDRIGSTKFGDKLTVYYM